MARMRIVLADDHAVLRAGLRVLVDAQPDMQVVGEAADGPGAVRQALQHRPDVLLLDITMPGMSGIEAMQRIRRDAPGVRVLVLTMHDDPAYMRTVLAAGAAGYLAKDVESCQLVAAIRAVGKGRTVADLGGDGQLRWLRPNDAGAAAQGGGCAPCLSRREWEVLELVALGYTNEQAAARLSVSVKTVEGYRTRLAEKLGLSGRAELVRFALEVGLLRPGRDIPGASRRAPRPSSSVTPSSRELPREPRPAGSGKHRAR